jgi:hypothetical protein
MRTLGFGPIEMKTYYESRGVDEFFDSEYSCFKAARPGDTILMDGSSELFESWQDDMGLTLKQVNNVDAGLSAVDRNMVDLARQEGYSETEIKKMFRISGDELLEDGKPLNNEASVEKRFTKSAPAVYSYYLSKEISR